MVEGEEDGRGYRVDLDRNMAGKNTKGDRGLKKVL